MDLIHKRLSDWLNQRLSNFCTHMLLLHTCLLHIVFNGVSYTPPSYGESQLLNKQNGLVICVHACH